MTLAIRSATPADLPLIAQFIRDLADYEKLAHEVRFDEATLGDRLFGARPYAEVLDAWRASIQRVPEEHTVQAYLSPSQMPTWVGQNGDSLMQPRAAILRVFAIFSALAFAVGTAAACGCR